MRVSLQLATFRRKSWRTLACAKFRRASWTIYVESCYLCGSRWRERGQAAKGNCLHYGKTISTHCLPFYSCRMPHRNGRHGALRMPHTGSAGTISLHRRPCAVRRFHRLSGGWGRRSKILHVLQDGKCCRKLHTHLKALLQFRHLLFLCFSHCRRRLIWMC